MQIRIPEHLQRVIQRDRFELSGAINNMCFMLTKYKDDISFFETETYKRLDTQIQELLLNEMIHSVAVCKLLGVPSNIGWRIPVDTNYLLVQGDIEVGKV